MMAAEGDAVIQVSTRGRYALRAMVDIAQYGVNGPVLRRDLAERQGISSDYVAQLFQCLKSAGLIEGVKGPGGGYTLARPAALISAADVVEAVEGPFAVVHCALPGQADQPGCARLDGCVTHLLWIQLSATIAEFLGSVTLQNLCDQAAQIGEKGPNRG